MAFFGVVKTRLDPDADRLDLAKIEGSSYQFVVARGEWTAGDECLYFATDSLMPEGLMLSLGLAVRGEDGQAVGKLSGPGRNRIKTMRLRGEISQGVIGRPDLIAGMGGGDPSPEAIAAFLGVQKWEPPAVFDANADLVPLPLGLGAYDIEGADRFAAAADELLDERVAITEKIEGMNCSFFAASGGQAWVNQRRYAIAPVEGKEHSFWALAQKIGALETAEAIRRELGAEHCGLYGEFAGPSVQGNIYRLAEHQVFFFDIMADGKFLPWAEYKALAKAHGLKTAPALEEGKTLREILGGRPLQDYSDGPSLLAKTAREGVVVRPEREAWSALLGGRLILKQRSPRYLAKSDN
jgi:RNA ligase (TIGR02306 family)